MKIEKSIINALSLYGLNDQEMAIYVALLRAANPLTVTQLSKVVEMNRTALYFHIEQLEEKGVIQDSKKSKVKRFRPVRPETLARRMQKRVLQFETSLPALQALADIDATQPEITMRNMEKDHFDFYMGLAGLPEGSTFRVIQSARSARADFESMTVQQWDQVFKTMVDRGIETRAIFTDRFVSHVERHIPQDTYKLFKKRVWHLRTLPESGNDFEEMFIHGDSVSFFLTDITLILTITHKRIARALTAVHDALWFSGRPTKWK